MPYTPVTLPIRQPLLPMDAVAAITGESVDKLVLLIEEGAFQYAWNIAVPGCHKRCLRVLANSVAEYVENGRRLHSDTPGQAFVVTSGIFPAISPVAVPEISAGHLARLFSCSGNQILRLVKAKCIKVTREGSIGRNGEVRFCRRSVLNFLLERRVR